MEKSSDNTSCPSLGINGRYDHEVPMTRYPRLTSAIFVRVNSWFGFMDTRSTT